MQGYKAIENVVSNLEDETMNLEKLTITHY